MNHARYGRLLVFAVSCALLTPASSKAQVFLGGEQARHVGLGGGGIALPDRRASSLMNPAVLADREGFRTNFSRVGTFGIGESAYDAINILIETHDFDRLLDIALPLGRERTVFGTENGIYF